MLYDFLTITICKECSNTINFTTSVRYAGLKKIFYSILTNLIIICEFLSALRCVLLLSQGTISITKCFSMLSSNI